MNLSLSLAELRDVIPVAAIIQDYKSDFLSDYDSFDANILIPFIENQELYTIYDATGYPVGCIRLFNNLDNLHSEISLIVRPEYLRQVLKQQVIETFFDAVFETGMGKLKASPMDCQKGAIKLLKRMQFKQVTKLYKETKKNGVLMDVCLFELRKGFWKKYRKQQKVDANG